MVAPDATTQQADLKASTVAETTFAGRMPRAVDGSVIVVSASVSASAASKREQSSKTPDGVHEHVSEVEMASGLGFVVDNSIKEEPINEERLEETPNPPAEQLKTSKEPSESNKAAG